MSTSQNGWPALEADSPKLWTWTIPARNGQLRIRLRNGSAGFLLCHFLLWWSERLDDLTNPHPADDWGYAWRPVRGQTTGLSNHASGTAVDADATQWPLGTEHMSRLMRGRINLRLRLYSGCLRWGGNYSGRKDQMHTEINRDLAAVERVARRLMKTPRGRRILAANPGQRRVILA